MSQVEVLHTAYKHILQGDLQTAEKLLTAVIRQEPRQEMAWLLLAACKSLPQEKEKCLEFAMEINPDNEGALEAYGELMRNRNPENAIVQAFMDWDTAQKARRKEEARQLAEAAALSQPAEAAASGETKGQSIRPRKTIWLWLAIVVLGAAQAVSWVRIIALEQALVAAQVRIQSLQTILTEYVVQLELLQQLLK